MYAELLCVPFECSTYLFEAKVDNEVPERVPTEIEETVVLEINLAHTLMFATGTSDLPATTDPSAMPYQGTVNVTGSESTVIVFTSPYFVVIKYSQTEPGVAIAKLS
jgi:hypothetical protein